MNQAITSWTARSSSPPFTKMLWRFGTMPNDTRNHRPGCAADAKDGTEGGRAGGQTVAGAGSFTLATEPGKNARLGPNQPDAPALGPAVQPMPGPGNPPASAGFRVCNCD